MPLVVVTLTVFPLAQGLGSTVPYVYLAIADAPFWLLAAVIVSCSQSSVARHGTAVACTGGIWLLTTTIAWTGLISSPTRVWTHSGSRPKQLRAASSGASSSTRPRRSS